MRTAKAEDMDEKGRNDLHRIRTEYQGCETFNHEGQPLLRPTNVEEYWAWAHSNLANNVERGLVAEYLVRHALELRDGPRDHWMRESDLNVEGHNIQVKCSAFMQSWEQSRDSKIQFRLKRDKLNCDLFIFAVWWAQGGVRPDAPISIIDVGQWWFFLITGENLRTVLENRRNPGAKTVSVTLKRLLEWTDGDRSRFVTYCDLGQEIRMMINAQVEHTQ